MAKTGDVDLGAEIKKLQKRILKLEKETLVRQPNRDSDMMNMCIGPSTRGTFWTE